MGRGIALSIKQRFPEAYAVYRQTYEREGLALGSISVARIRPDFIIVNAITQDHYWNADPRKVLVDYDALEEAFGHIRAIALAENLPVNFPLIGCGLAKGRWEEVAPRIERALGPDVEKHLWRLPASPQQSLF